MPITAAQAVKRIGQKILLLESEAPIPPDISQDILFQINVYMSAQDTNGIKLGFTWLNDLGDTVTIADGAIMGLIANVAVVMAGEYNMPVSQSLLTEAATGLDAMRKIGVQIGSTAFPETLPIGSGNEFTDSEVFYPEADNAIEGEQGGFIVLENNNNV